MISFTLAFLLGDLYLQYQSHLPNITWLTLISLACVLCGWRARQYLPYFYLLSAFCLGLLWSTWYASSILSWTLPKAWENKPLLVRGRIASLPTRGPYGVVFKFYLSQLEYEDHLEKPRAFVRLIWPEKPPATSTSVSKTASMTAAPSLLPLPVKVGEQWQFMVSLKRIHATQSPGAFDFEAWALQNGIRASGHIINDTHTQLLAHHWYVYPIDQFRQYLYDQLQPLLPASATAPWLTALIIGERSHIPSENWQVLRNTGTNHLMAIAGLHIGAIAGLTYLLLSWLWSRLSALVLYFPAQTVGHVSALMVAITYSAMAGFSLPTQRACYMLMLITFTTLLRRKTNPWNIWSLALFMVLLINPLCVLTESFWLSFITIALIIYSMHARVAPAGVWWKWGRVQWVVGIGLIPVSLTLFQQCSLISFVANSIAIPWLSIFVLPFCFLAALCILLFPPFAACLLSIADKSLSGLWQLLSWLAQWDYSVWTLTVPTFALLIITSLAFFSLLLPAGTPAKWLGALWGLPLLLHPAEKPMRGDMWLTLLDVGQGLSVVVQTNQHVLVYDTGPRYRASIDTGESVVLPYLHTIAAKKIDMLVISHGDMDHIGGAQAIMQSLPIDAIKTSVPEKIPTAYTSYCRSNTSWEWDQIKFSFLYPPPNSLGLGNDSSCVLKIENGRQAILLTGDIEKRAELDLLNHVPEQLAADILVAPHHGSKTSGLHKFISAVHPLTVLYATGYLNRYHFPHASTVLEYEELGSEQFNTVTSGTLLFKINKNNGLIAGPEEYRIRHQRYWFDEGH